MGFGAWGLEDIAQLHSQHCHNSWRNEPSRNRPKRPSLAKPLLGLLAAEFAQPRGEVKRRAKQQPPDFLAGAPKAEAPDSARHPEATPSASARPETMNSLRPLVCRSLRSTKRHPTASRALAELCLRLSDVVVTDRQVLVSPSLSLPPLLQALPLLFVRRSELRRL